MFRRDLTKKYIEKGFSQADAVAEVDFALEIIAGLTQNDILLGKEPQEVQKVEIVNCIEQRLSTGAPIQQILGKAFFMGDVFEVTEDTLIPRPETEILVREAIKLIKENNFIKALDIGTGSGCIAIEIAKNVPDIEVLSVDISQNAIKIAEKNAFNIGVLGRVSFLESDIFSKINEKFDLIISNPPYIPLSEKVNLQPEVRDFEPHSALFTEDKEGISFYKKIIEKSSKYLNENGYIAFELGINQADMVKDLFIKNNFHEVKIIKDLDNIERVILAKFNIS